MTGPDKTESGVDNKQTDLRASVDWLQSVAALLLAVARLGLAEVSLAREDLGRIILISIVLLPLVLLTWIALSVLLSWLVFVWTLSATYALVMFTAIQLVTVLLLLSKLKTCRHSLSLPATRAQIKTIIEEVRYETGRPHSSDREV